ncbi:MAG: hypothetical protein KC503_08175 [Myxococcales bacterium]|nr:hypothetical protein [Myxococcales bacterium]
MKLQLRKYFWAFNLLTILVCAYFLAHAVTSWISGKLPHPRKRRGAYLGAVPAALAGPKIRDVNRIAARNIFCSTCKPEAPAVGTGAGTGSASNATASGEPVKSSLKLKLIATLVSDQDAKWSYAALKDPDEDKTRLYGIGAKLASTSATITDIDTRRVLLNNGGRREFIELDKGDDASRPRHLSSPVNRRTTYRPRRSSLFAGLANGVRKLGPGKWEIRRSALNKVLGNTTLLARSARIVPSVRNGKPNGFKLYAIRPGSIYSLIGMSNGDTIHAINGHAITTPDKALEVYTKVRNASHLTISFTRRGKTTTHDYTIR